MSIEVALELQPCCGQRSGIGTYTYELARHMVNNEALTFNGNLFNFLMRNDTSCLNGINYNIYYNKYMPYGVYCRLWDIFPLRYDALFPHKTDITHFFNYITPPGIKGKIITTIYDLVYLRHPETMDKGNLKRLKKGLDKSIRRSDAIVTDSYYVKDELVREFELDREKVHVIYPSASVPLTNLPLSYLSEKWNIRAPYILFLGNIEPRKNLVRLISAYSKVRAELPVKFQLVLAGGKGWRSDAIYTASEKSCFSEDIIFTGYVSANEKNALYDNAELFVLPSIYEGFGIPVLEAMKCAVPVVCSNTSSLPEIAGDCALFADPFSEADLADKMIKILTDKESARRIAQSGQVRAESFSWEKSAERLMKLYMNLA